MKSILLAKTDGFGDAILGLRLLRPLLAAGHQVVWIASPAAAAAAELLESRDRLTVVETALNGYQTAAEIAAEEFPALLARLDGRAFDLALCGSTSGNWLDETLVSVAAASQRIILRRENQRSRLPLALLPLVRPRLGVVDLVAIHAFLPEVIALEQILARTGLPVPPDPGLPGSPAPRAGILIAPGKPDAARAWPAESFAEILVALRGSGSAPSIELLAGSLDRPACEAINAALIARGEAPAAIRVLDAPDPRAAAEQLRRAALLVCNDTGWVHLAAATITPTVAIFGAAQPGRFEPTVGPITCVRAEPVCMGCDWACLFDTRRCIAEIPAAPVLAAIHARLADPGRLPETIGITMPDPTISARLVERLRELTADRNAHVWECDRLRTRVAELTHRA